MGKGFYKLPTDHAKPDEHKKVAQEALKKAQQLLGKVDVLILDEINNAVVDRLIKVSEVIKVIEGRGKTHLILTGRNASAELVEVADLVTEMKKVKHPFDKDIKAMKGLDF